MFKCILCFSTSKLNKPIELTKKVNHKLTLEGCIRQNLSCADAMFDDGLAGKLSCTNCYLEFVNFYEFLGKIEEIYEPLKKSLVQPKIKTELNDDFPSDNFVAVPDYYSLLKTQLNIKDCFVKLKRVDGDQTEIKEIVKEIEDDHDSSHEMDCNYEEPFNDYESSNELEESQKEQKITPNTSHDLNLNPSITLSDLNSSQVLPKNESHDSDFEWPTNDDWLPPATSEEPKKKGRKHKTNDEVDNDYNPEKDPTTKPKRRKKKKVEKRDRRNELRTLPRWMLTPDILATEGNVITIDGVTYNIPRRNRYKPVKQKVPRGTKRTLDPTRRPHPAWDPEGEQKIRNFVDVRCHVCGEQYLTFHRLKKHVKKSHPAEQGFLVCCNKKFTRRYELIDHLDRHERTEYFCRFCNDGIDHKTMSELRTHIKTNHIVPDSSINDNDHICENCGKVYASANGLKAHLKNHSLATYECSLCHQEQISMNALKNHMKLHEQFSFSNSQEEIHGLDNLDYELVNL